MAQIFATNFGLSSQSYPMSHKDKAHEAFGLLFAWEDVPPKMFVDDVKEMKLGEFAPKYKEASCYLQSTSPILNGLTPLSMRLGNSKRVPPGNRLSKGCPSGYGALCWNMNRMFTPTLHMTSIV
jgi:hypothetical protein